MEFDVKLSNDTTPPEKNFRKMSSVSYGPGGEQMW